MAIGRSHAWFVVLGLALAGCTGGEGGRSLHLRLQDPDPEVRMKAMAEAAGAKDPQAVPYIVTDLSNDDGDVRLFASLALEKITGQTMGYEYFQPREQREKAVTLWKQWLAGGRKASATQTSQPATHGASSSSVVLPASNNAKRQATSSALGSSRASFQGGDHDR